MKKVLCIIISVILVFSTTPIVTFALPSSTVSKADLGLTAEQQAIMSEASQKWIQTFITNNDAISNGQITQNEKDYLTVKTIYDFVIQNTKYNTEAYESYMNGGTVNYYAHTAFAALFGEDAENSQSLSDTGYNWQTTRVNNIITIANDDQGYAVCEGYTALFQYLCNLCNIDCITVIGTKQTVINGVSKKDDHSWNYVYLDDSTSSGKEWFQIDTTYASSNSVRYVGYTNFYYFLCGSENDYFSSEYDHPLIYTLADGYNYPSLSVDDYSFDNYKESLSSFDTSNYVAIVRKSDSGQTAFNDYLLLKKEENGFTYWRLRLDENSVVVKDANNQPIYDKLPLGEGFDYKGEKGTFFVIVPGYVYGGEYTAKSDDSNPYSPGNHTITASDNITNIDFEYIISKIDMEKTSSEIELENVGENNSVQYSGESVVVGVDITDGFEQKLTENEDFVVNYYDENNREVASPTEPGSYNITIDFNASDRYKGKLVGNSNNKLHFTITKIDLGSVAMSDVKYVYTGKSISTLLPKFVWTSSQGTKKEFVSGKDYTLSFSGSTVNAGNGAYTISPTANSNYLMGSKIGKYSITAAPVSKFANYTACGSYKYTGSAIKPTDLSTFINNINKSVGYTYITKNDLTVTGYTSNVNAGTAYVKISGKNNFAGSSTLKFTIAKKPITDSDVYFSYKNCTDSSADITLKYKSRTLKNSTDYKKSFSISGYYTTLTVSGVGNYTGSYKLKYHHHIWKQTSSKSATYFAGGYKKYKCYGCGKTKTTTLAQKKPSISKLSSGYKNFYVKWGKCSGVSGYQIQYSTSSKFTSSTKIRVSGSSSVSKTVKSLKSKKKYYVRVRPYKKSGTKYTYGIWSSTKSVTTK